MHAIDDLVLVGMSQRTAPVAVRERYAVSEDDARALLQQLSQGGLVEEGVVLSTCNRTEVYVVAELFHGAYGDVRDFLCEISNLSVDELTPHLYSQHDQAAVTHLFEVAAGLDSVVLGESEILGQVGSPGRLNPSRRRRRRPNGIVRTMRVSPARGGRVLLVGFLLGFVVGTPNAWHSPL